ncbi:MAG TPA: twin-arginine translocase subunit TatC [Spirochaetota bacterium]|nr:twin-arginine translocase subunit TatC [Spirochaetota bacterium]
MYRKRKFALIAIWIIAAVITPPDVLSQTIAAIPMMLLYEISAFIAFICARE